MQINELKKLIENNTLHDDFLIFLSKESEFLVWQYINTIAENKSLEINRINNLSEISSAISLVFDFKQKLNVLSVEEFNEVVDDYSALENTIVVCNKVSKAIEQNVNEYIIEFPKLLNWQIKDYMSIYCPGLETEDIDWLYSATNGNIYRILNELDKVNLFNQKDRTTILNELRFDKYSDLYYQTVFNICEALVKKDKLVLLEYLKHQNVPGIDIDPFHIISILVGKLKQILYVNFNCGKSLEQIGITQKQANAIRYYYRECSEKFVVCALEFLTGIDKRIKLGELEVNNLNDYIICHLLSY